MNGLKIFSGSGNVDLAEKIAGLLHSTLGKIHIGRFADGEIGVWVEEDVWGERTILIAPTCNPVNDRLIEASLIIDALRRGGAKCIMTIIPYFGYARQDRQTRLVGSEPISAKVAAILLESCGATSVFTIDIHSTTETGFLKIPFVNLPSTSIFEKRLKKENLAGGVVISPDEGGVERARDLAVPLRLSLAFLTKIHSYDIFDRQNQVDVVAFVGEVKGKTAIIYDDVASSGQTLFKNAQKLKENGAKRMIGCITHCALIEKAYDELERSALDKLFVTDTIPLIRKSKKIEVLSIAPLLAEEIKKRVG